jgi:hypothetical protein
MEPMQGASISTVEAVLSRTELTATAFDTQTLEGLIGFALTVGAATAGDTKTLACKLTHCDTSGGIYTDVTGGAYTTLTTVAGDQLLLIPKKALKRYVKLSATHGSANAAYPYGLQAIAVSKYE